MYFSCVSNLCSAIRVSPMSHVRLLKGCPQNWDQQTVSTPLARGRTVVAALLDFANTTQHSA